MAADPTATRFDFPGSGWILIDRAEQKVWLREEGKEPKWFPEFEVLRVTIKRPALFGLIRGEVEIMDKFGEKLRLKLKGRAAYDEALRLKAELETRGGRIVSS
jgi:hypothetical protein